MKRYREKISYLNPIGHVRLFYALRERLKEGYSLSDFRADLMSGIIVAMVAIPLGMALGIASGVAPQYGLYTVVLAGGLVALLGGSRMQVTGPTAAFVVILVPIVYKFGFPGLLVSGFLAGIMLVLMGVARMGRLIEFIPYPVTTGFTTGIAVVIATLQLKDFFGLSVAHMPERYVEKVQALASAFPTFSWIELAIGVFTLTFLLVWPKFNKKIPAPILALTSISIVAALLKAKYPDLSISTIGNRFSFVIDGVTGHGIPQALPHFTMPWNFVGADGKTMTISWSMIEALLPSAFAIAMLGAIESLLSAVVADGMAQTKHEPNAELIALGIGNILCPFFGGIPATGAIARTATNIRFGARSPISAIIHAVITLLVILVFAKYVSYLPMAALSALLMLVAYNMSELRHFKHIVKLGPKSDVIVLLICFSLTVLFDMVIGVSVGVVLAAMLFMKRMAQVTETTKFSSHNVAPIDGRGIPSSFVLYEIAGPLFFGVAEKATQSILDVGDDVKGIIFQMNQVPAMDITGLVAFESIVKKLQSKHRKIIIFGLQAQPAKLINKSFIAHQQSGVIIRGTFRDVLDYFHPHF